LALVAGCGDRNAFKPPPPPAVTIAQPQTRDIVDWIEFTGSTKATATVELRSRVKGYLQEVRFEDGSHVKHGDLLFVIEKTPFEAELEAAEAALAKAQAATQLAKANLTRTKQLVAERAVSDQQLDVDTAELATAEANERAAGASLIQAKLNLSYTEIRAPMDGRIGRHLVDVGNLVLPDSTLLAVIESIDPIHAYFSVSERDLLRIMDMLRKNLLPDPEKHPPELFLSLADEDNFPHKGVLDFREVGVDPSTGTTLRRALFDNKNSLLLPGMFVRIRGALGKAQPQLVIEERAIGSDQRGNFVLVVNDKNLVEYRPVKLGSSEQGQRVILEGLKANEWIVVNGLQRARPGAPVTPEKAAVAALQVAKPTAPKATAPKAEDKDHETLADSDD
jgi:RND family efflux transporter MFP subunit